MPSTTQHQTRRNVVFSWLLEIFFSFLYRHLRHPTRFTLLRCSGFSGKPATVAGNDSRRGIMLMNLTQKRPKPRVRPRAEDQAVNWFLTLELAAADGDFAFAAKAQRELARLGWRVERVPSRTVAVGRGGAR
jgi:hypothetical protein